MSTLTVEDHKEIAKQINEWTAEDDPIQWEYYTASHSYLYTGRVVPKQRPRKGKGGRMFTPPETRDFEKSVKEWGVEEGMQAVLYPIRVNLVIYDRTQDSDLRMHGLCGLTFYDKKDVDNMAKSILDGLNGVLFKDDKQIVDLRVRRRWSYNEGFRMKVERAGMSKSEYTRFLKYLKAERLNGNS